MKIDKSWEDEELRNEKNVYRVKYIPEACVM